jgi:hypothetical protein
VIRPNEYYTWDILKARRVNEPPRYLFYFQDAAEARLHLYPNRPDINELQNSIFGLRTTENPNPQESRQFAFVLDADCLLELGFTLYPYATGNQGGAEWRVIDADKHTEFVGDPEHPNVIYNRRCGLRNIPFSCLASVGVMKGVSQTRKSTREVAKAALVHGFKLGVFDWKDWWTEDGPIRSAEHDSNPPDEEEPTPETDRLISELGDDASDPWGAGPLQRFVWLDAASRKGAIQEANRLIASGLELNHDGPESIGGINYLHVGGDEWVKILHDDYDNNGYFAELAIEDLPDGFVLYSNDPFIMDKGEYNAYSAMIVSDVHDRIPPQCIKLVGVHDTEEYIAEHYPDEEDEETGDA